ncbi:2,3-dehydroadipyl-CoA hydratase [BD1-7 clade bacterium]|uniref:2,3-dehydroadipyl-CoA hydratase n=1 Tax=BD1-7 clade bacterium TaxID=2029982 RepID=A0A5S9R0T4_9GAMM|nr:2,3-dehydroadipyl-CoA hydratase [BD1-7 clade bacterium]
MQQITVQTDNAICVVGINRPEKKNALTADMYQAMADAVNAASADTNVKVVILTGIGEHFTAGNDLGEFLADPSMDEDSSVYCFLQAIARCEIPMIAAVEGFAVGIGCTLLLHCERVICDSTARFAFPFVNLAIVPEAASSLLLPRLVGYQQAAHLLLTGDTFDANEALEMGLAAEKTETGEALQTAMTYAEKLTGKARGALVATKQLLRRDDEPVQDRLHHELAIFVEKLQAPAAKEAMTAFMEKRKPDFTGL